MNRDMNHFSPSPLPDPSSLEWLAFRYVADELSESEREAFEGRLAEDQAAREAVAAAVELAQAVAWVEHETTPSRNGMAASPTPARERTRRWATALGWMLVGSAACLAGLTLVNHLRKESAEGPFGATAMIANEEPRQLALAWSQTRRDAEFADAADVLSSVESLGAEANAEHSESAEAEGGEAEGGETETSDSSDSRMLEGDESSVDDPMAAMSRQTPSWIMAAVSESGSEAKEP